MQRRYRIRQDDDHSWSVMVEGADQPLRLAGRLQTQLTRAEAEVTLELLCACQRQEAGPIHHEEPAAKARTLAA